MDNFDHFVEATIVRVIPDNRAKKLTVEVQAADRSCLYLAEADGVYDLLMDGFRLNNIIDEVVCCTTSMESAEWLPKLHYLMTGNSGLSRFGDSAHVDSMAEVLRRGEMGLWEFRPVYGASLLILAKSLSSTKVA